MKLQITYRPQLRTDIAVNIVRIVMLCGFLLLVAGNGMSQIKEKGKSNRKEIRAAKRKQGSKQGEKAYKGDITGRRLSPKKPREGGRNTYQKTNPYAGRKQMGEKQRMKYLTRSPRSASRNTERAAKSRSYGRSSMRITFTGKNAYKHDVIPSASRGSERPVKKQRIVPRTSSGAYVMNKRKNPYKWRKTTPWEKAYKGDITGAKFTPKRTVDRPGLQKSPIFDNRSNKRRGDKAYSGRIRGGFLSVSGQRRERAGKGTGGYVSATRPAESTSRYRNPRMAMKIKSRPPKWRHHEHRPYYSGSPGGDRPYKGVIKGGYRSITRQAERDGATRYSGRTKLNLSGGITSYSGNIRNRRAAKGGGSVSRNRWNNQGNPLARRSATRQDISTSKYRGDARGGGRPYDGPRNYASGFKMHNNNGNPVKSRKYSLQDRRIARYSGMYRGTNKEPKGAGGSISVLPWNNDGKPLDKKPVSPESRRATSYVGNVKGFKYKKNPGAHEDALMKREAGRSYAQVAGYKGTVRQKFRYKKNPHAADESLKKRPAGTTYAKIANYQGTVKRSFRYMKNPNSADGALKHRGPSRAMISASNYQGNIKMTKKSLRDRHPSYKYEREQTNSTAKSQLNLKLFWSKMFKKQENQPKMLKEKVREPRFDKGEKGLWND